MCLQQFDASREPAAVLTDGEVRGGFVSAENGRHGRQRVSRRVRTLVRQSCRPSLSSSPSRLAAPSAVVALPRRASQDANAKGNAPTFVRGQEVGRRAALEVQRQNLTHWSVIARVLACARELFWRAIGTCLVLVTTKADCVAGRKSIQMFENGFRCVTERARLRRGELALSVVAPVDSQQRTRSIRGGRQGDFYAQHRDRLPARSVSERHPEHGAAPG